MFKNIFSLQVIEEIIEYFEESDQEIDFNSSNSQINSPTQLSDEKPGEFKKPSTIAKKPSKICEFCGITVRVRNYKSHIMIHTGQKPFICVICQRSFRTSSSCKIHQSTHLKERNFNCHYCSKSFICRNSLAKHKLTHSRDMKFECQVCSAKFYRQSCFRTHLSSHGIGISHYCKICQKGFLWEARLKEHMNEHEGIKPFKCEHCTKTFSKKRNLSSHIRLVHKLKNEGNNFQMVEQDEMEDEY